LLIFSEKKIAKIFLQKTSGQGHLAKKFFSKNIFFSMMRHFFLHQKLFNSKEYINFYESYSAFKNRNRKID